jgi:predicted transcriptional regulator
MSIQPTAVRETLHDRFATEENWFGARSVPAIDGILLAIQQPHSQAILRGDKDVEFRRTRLVSDHPDCGFIYETSPTQAIVGLVVIESVEWLPLNDLQTLAHERTPSTRESIAEYFAGQEGGTAIMIDEVYRIEPAISLHGKDGEWAFTPPQNFQYIDPYSFLDDLGMAETSES